METFVQQARKFDHVGSRKPFISENLPGKSSYGRVGTDLKNIGFSQSNTLLSYDFHVLHPRLSTFLL